jgi:DsbC/DsbD-like thiol-disulfide interchange protein
MNKLAAIALLSAAVAHAGGAFAGASDWQEFEGASLRAVVSDAASAHGTLRAALEIQLKPGWKTYWLDPGDSGVPPMVEARVDGTAVPVTIDLPAPARHSDGYATFAGYNQPLAMALTLTPPDGAAGSTFDLDVFVGICETICIPVQATFSVPATSSGDEHLVEAAFAALPAPADATFGIRSAWTQGDELIVDVALPDGMAEAELFVASTPLFAMGAPRRDGQPRRFRVPLLDRPTNPTASELARYTLVAGDRSVAGTIRLTGHP